MPAKGTKMPTIDEKIERLQDQALMYKKKYEENVGSSQGADGEEGAEAAGRADCKVSQKQENLRPGDGFS